MYFYYGQREVPQNQHDPDHTLREWPQDIRDSRLPGKSDTTVCFSFNESKNGGIITSKIYGQWIARLVVKAEDIQFIDSPKFTYNFMKRNNYVNQANISVGHLPTYLTEKKYHIGNMEEVPVKFDLNFEFAVSKKGFVDFNFNHMYRKK
ncbi:hypothetical protein RF11_01746 [Thelohanellus kitauei]|uniref:Uncharacterized protein n=1 Tax=Thelohanellus kitauei TaxID=669202 RepID=A0A0C2M9N0_THEKT|nr:hypothetical protein RF11_01746 [Thelohanellus kitauei]